MTQTNKKAAPINLRAKPQQRSLIDRAAKILGKNRSDFMLDVACREAENVLLDQRFFHLDKKTFDAFNNALDAPVKESKKLKVLLNRKPQWED